jgi:FKBP-type peptidyl-prolyl cis-trans isomerase
MNKQIFLALFMIFAFATAEAKPKKPKKVAPVVDSAVAVIKNDIEFKTNIDTVSYFIGMQIGTDMQKNGVNDINAAALQKGLTDALNNIAPKIDPQIAMMYAQAYFGQKQAAKKAAEEAKAKAFFESLASNPNIKTTASGLKYDNRHKTYSNR